MFKSKYWNFLFICVIFLVGCQKELKYDTAADRLTDKVWYLEKLVNSSSVYSYRWVVTFSFNMEKSSGTFRDSDGLRGNYEIVESQLGIWIHLNSPGRVIESYKVTQLERDHFVAECVKNNDFQVLYFSTRL